jgi:hypothetical protein
MEERAADKEKIIVLTCIFPPTGDDLVTDTIRGLTVFD